MAWQSEKENGKEETDEDTGIDQEPQELVKELKEKNEELEKLVEELRHGWKSALAEQDNIRKRAAKGKIYFLWNDHETCTQCQTNDNWNVHSSWHVIPAINLNDSQRSKRRENLG